MNEPTKNKSFFSRVGRWLAELILVFVGVYATFWLNNYQQHQQETKRRDQILASLEQQLQEGIENSRTEGATEEGQLQEFRRALEAGEMPPIKPFSFTSDYSASDVATLLQSGGIEVLDLKMLIAWRNLESVIRWGLTRMASSETL